MAEFGEIAGQAMDDNGVGEEDLIVRIGHAHGEDVALRAVRLLEGCMEGSPQGLDAEALGPLVREITPDAEEQKDLLWAFMTDGVAEGEVGEFEEPSPVGGGVAGLFALLDLCGWADDLLDAVGVGAAFTFALVA